MRKVLLGFMTLLMLTPILTCAMTLCPMKAAQAAEEKSCHEVDDNQGLMLALDCMGVDLFYQDVSNDIPSDLSIEGVDYAWADLVDSYSIVTNNTNAIRGPPDWSRRLKSDFSIILKTQRFRI